MKQKRIAFELKQKGMTQTQLAQAADVNEASLSRIIAGKEDAFPKRGQRIADALGWSGPYEELFEDVEVGVL